MSKYGCLGIASLSVGGYGCLGIGCDGCLVGLNSWGVGNLLGRVLNLGCGVLNLGGVLNCGLLSVGLLNGCSNNLCLVVRLLDDILCLDGLVFNSFGILLYWDVLDKLLLNSSGNVLHFVLNGIIIGHLFRDWYLFLNSNLFVLNN